jgi:hypothetical protein
MISKPLAVGLLAAGCLTAAAGGAYVATRSNAADAARIQHAMPAAAPAVSTQPVSETEGVVTPAQPQPEAAPATAPAVQRQAAAEPVNRPRSAQPARTESTRTMQPARETAPRNAPAPTPPARSTSPAVEHTATTAEQNGPASSPPPVDAPAAEPQRAAEPSAPPVPQLEEVIVPSASVIGLQVSTPVSSERARVEDRVEARVTRDVMSGNRVAIPAGSRVLGTVTVAERGGKIKERARLGVRFHTLVLADGTEVPMRTEAIFREGEPPSGESARKIGGAAIGGAILGAIMGGGKGAVLGGATGAAGGTAAVMAGDRNAATLPAGTILTVRLSEPVSIEVEKDRERQ